MIIPFFVSLIAWFFQAFTGFGAGIFIVGLLSLIYEPKTVVVSSTVANLIGNFFVFLSLRNKAKPNFKLLIPLILGSFFGIIAGTKVLVEITSELLKILIGVFISFLGLYDFLVQREKLKLRFKANFLNGLFMGFLGGIFAGLVGIGGPPPVVYLNQVCKSVNVFKITLSFYFSFNVITRMLSYLLLGEKNYWSFELILSTSLATPLGVFAGLYFSKLFTEKRIKEFISLSVFILGIFLIFEQFGNFLSEH